MNSSAKQSPAFSFLALIFATSPILYDDRLAVCPHCCAEQVAIQNLEVIDIRPEENLLLVKGAVPGAKHGVVIVRSATKG